MKDTFATIISSTFMSATVLACTVTNETTPAKVELDATVAKTQASALTAAVTAAESSDGAAIADAIAKVGDVTAALVPATKAGARSLMLGASSTCSCPSGATSCTFAACTIGDATVSGTVSWTDGTITCTNLAFDAAATAHVEITCALTYTSGDIGGTIRTTGSATVSGTAYGWDATLTAKDITFTSSALTGGGLEVAVTVTTDTTAGGEKSYSASAVVTLP